jgi:hypothetical protein
MQIQDFESCGKVDHKRQTFIVGKNRDVQVGTTQVTRLGEKNNERERKRIQHHWGKQYSFTGEEIVYYHASESMSRQYEKMRHYLLSNKVIACQDND